MTTSYLFCRWPAEATLPDGRSLHLRRLHPTDRPAITRSLARLSVETATLRFGTPVPLSKPSLLDDLCALDEENHVAWGAFDGGDLVSVFRYRRRPEEARTATLAGYVLDGYQRRGLARRLVTMVGAEAAYREVEAFAFDVYPVNLAVRTWARRHGIRLLPRDGMLHGCISLADRAGPDGRSLESPCVS